MQFRDATPTSQSEKVSSVPSSSAAAMLLSNGTLTQEPSGTTKKRFFFSTSNIRFWTTGRPGKKTPKNKLSNSTADIVNHGDQLRYIKEERYSMRRLATSLKLKFEFFFFVLNALIQLLPVQCVYC
uniref:Uncharacterized protein n=1 Tax=Setaria digitata TaxID=48799 RepID=A0A915PY52_9BILA